MEDQMSRRTTHDPSSPYSVENAGKENRIIDLDIPDPFAGIGANVAGKSVEQMMKRAKLDWTTERTQLSDARSPVPAYSLRRSDNHEYLDTVGRAYVPINNRDAFEFFSEFVERGDAKLAQAGILGGGRYVWALADLGTSFELKGGDKVGGYMLIAIPHVQGRKLVIKYTNMRFFCNNMLTGVLQRINAKGKQSAVSLPEFRHAHRSAFKGEVTDRAREILKIARTQHDAFGEVAAKLQKKRMSDEDAVEVLAPIFAPKHDEEKLEAGELSPRLETLIDLLHNAPGADPGNAWGVLNAVTYYTTHVAGRTQDRRLTQSWMGRTGNQVTQTVEALIAA
jgi:phage/plasmid-like protein (TIGR03299 family)